MVSTLEPKYTAPGLVTHPYEVKKLVPKFAFECGNLCRYVSALFNGAAAVGMLAIFKSPQVQLMGNVVAHRAAEIGLFAIGGVFTVEAFAHLVILTSFIMSAAFFGTTNLEGFVDATRHLASSSSLSTGQGGGKGGGRGISRSRSYPLACRTPPPLSAPSRYCRP
jgi:hypothetical protein